MIRACAVFLLACLPLATFAAETEMTYEEYEIALAGAQEREKTAKEQIAGEQAKIISLKQRLSEIDQLIAQVMREKYDILGITEQDVIDAENEIAAIRQEIELLMQLSPDELARRIGDIRKIEARLASLKARPVSKLWRVRDKIRDAEGLLERLNAMLPDKPMAYTVREIPERRDCLWRISEYDFIYGDPTQWPKIYQANKAVIEKGHSRYAGRAQDPKYSRVEDLIFPGQELDIPR